VSAIRPAPVWLQMTVHSPLLRLPALLLVLLHLIMLPAVRSLQNGAALTPPMSWLSWQRYRCSAEFNETLIRATADALVSEGYKDAGYEYVCLDDCWQGRRDKDGHLSANEKFPSGIKALAVRRARSFSPFE
jgi:hypothetical protein